MIDTNTIDQIPSIDEGIWRTLDCSTIHVAPQDEYLIREEYRYRDDIFIFKGFTQEDGYIIQVPDDVVLPTMTWLSISLYTLFLYARSRNCWLIKLSRDGTVFSDLVKYTWL